MKLWYALRSKPNKEWPLYRELEAGNVECCYPQLRVHPINPRSRTMRPYFPGYLFVHTDIVQMERSTFKWMPFSLGLVSFDNQPASVPESLINALRRHLEEKNKSGGEPSFDLKQGETVVIRDGLFNGYEAIFNARLSGNDRVRVLIRLLRDRQTFLELPAEQVQRKKTH